MSIVLKYIATGPTHPDMVSRGAPPDFARVVAESHRRMRGWIWATSEPCISIGLDEVKRVRRNLELVRAGGAPPARAVKRWGMVAVLLCPGDTAVEVVAWLGLLDDADTERIRFYVHPRTDLVEALAACYGAGRGDALTAQVEDYATFHKQFGRDFSNQVYRDAVEAGR